MTGVALASLASMPPPVVVEYFIVGGGGGGGFSCLSAGGGGGGGEGKNANAIVAPGDTWTITVGAGGTSWNYFNPYLCPGTLNEPTSGGCSCITPLNICAGGGGRGGGNCTYPVAPPYATAYFGSEGALPGTPPFRGGGVGGGGSICQSAPCAFSNRIPGRPSMASQPGSGAGGCGVNNNPPLVPPGTTTPTFGAGGTPSGGCWRVGGGGGGGNIPPALGNNGTNGTFSGGSASNNLIICGGAGGAGFFVPWAGEPAGAYYGGGGGGGVKNNLRTNCPGGTAPLFRCQDNRIDNNSGPGGLGGGGTGPREDYSPAGVGFGITQATLNTPPGNFRFGEANTGGGASGSGSTCSSPPNVNNNSVQSGAFGGSGVAFIRYPANFRLAVTTGNPTVSVKDGYIIYKFTGSGTIQF